MSVKPKIEVTADGSHTLFVPELDEHYHSVNGAIQESLHVFIDAGLKHCRTNEIHIFEVGFGTGLNAFLTLVANKDLKKTIHYTGIELYPLPTDLIERLNYAQAYTTQEQSLYNRLHSEEWEREVQIASDFYLRKIKADMASFDWSAVSGIDLIYFDAFAPDKQSDLWTQDIFDNIYRVANEEAILVTYCAKGTVRRMMQQAGFKVERVPGPPGKREMLRASKDK